MRVLLVATEIPPPFGGMETWLLDLAQGLSQRHQVAVVGPAERDWSFADSWNVAAFHCPDMRQLIQRDFQQVVELVGQAVRSFRPDIVHLAQTGLSFLIPSLRDQGWPVVVTVHCGDLTKPWISIFERPEMHRQETGVWLSQASRIMAVSRYSRECAVEAGARSPIDIIPCGVDADLFIPADRQASRRKLGLPLDRLLLLSLGRLVARKGFQDVVSCLPALRSLGPMCVIAGKGYEEAAIRDLVRELDVGDCSRLLGEVDFATKLLLYQAADVFVLPTFEKTIGPWQDVEGFGIVYLEAAACELPTVATWAGGVADAIAHGETGLLVARAILQL